MVFGFGKKKKRAEEPKDPIAAYDGLIEDLDRQGAEVRKSAATLLALRGELTRDLERYSRRVAEVRERLRVAGERHDGGAARVLQRDLDEAEELLESTRRALAAAEADAQLLLEAAGELADRAAELRAERTSARARLSVGLAVSSALRARTEKIDRILALDAARDEVERAHALAEVYREDLPAGRSRRR